MENWYKEFNFYSQLAIMKTLGQDVGIIITGEKGVGKSTFAIELDKQITHTSYDEILENLIFEARDFMERIKKLKNTMIVWDEVGLELFSRESMTTKNRLIAKIFQAFRFKYINVIFTIPSIWELDIELRRLANFHINVVWHGIGVVNRIYQGASYPLGMLYTANIPKDVYKRYFYKKELNYKRIIEQIDEKIMEKKIEKEYKLKRMRKSIGKVIKNAK